MTIVLASGSPRRSELLRNAGILFEIHISPAEEIHDATLEPHILCIHNAILKAAAVAQVRGDATVIGADTLVFIDGAPLGKPADLADARSMLRRLSGRIHHVCTGVCIISPGGKQTTFHDLTEVTFLPIDDAEIDAYFTKVNPLDKAGAYGIQEHGDTIIAGIKGCFDNVMGLPVTKVIDALHQES